jgi:hypothetical protein
MNIHQLGITFDPMEDRLLLRINTSDREELEVWLTRRIALRWAPQLSQFIAERLTSKADVQTALLNRHDQQMYADLKLHEQWGKSDFNTPFQRGDKKILPHGPLLLTDLQMTQQTDGLTLLRMQEREREHGSGRALEIRLNVELMSGLLRMLQEALPGTGWSDLPSSQDMPALGLDAQPNPPGHLLN